MDIQKLLNTAKSFLFKYRLQASTAVLSLIVLCFLVSVLSHLGTEKRKMYFPMVGSEKIEKEIRYLPVNKNETSLEIYISELLLGPEIHRARPLFSLGTALEFLSEKNGVLYVGLSQDALFQTSDSAEFYTGTELFKKNIKKNFKKIKDVQIFVDGVYIQSKN